MFFTCPLKEDTNSTSLMKWKCYQKVLHGKTRVGKNNFVLCLQYKESIAKVFLDYLRPRVKKFIYHNYVYHFQDEQYHTCMESFPEDFILFIINVAKNYIFQNYHEIQEMHWHSFQITILVHICYKWNPNYVHAIENGEKRSLTKYHYYIFDDNNHDTFLVQHYFELHWAHLTTRGSWPNKHLVWSNGCATQFKSQRTWYHVAWYVYISSYYFQLFLMKQFHSSSCSSNNLVVV
jgi:hypothetical protein